MRIPDAPKTSQGYYEARPGDVATRAASLVVIDVRETSELTEELGHIHGVRHVPMQKLVEEGLPDVALDAPVALVCRSGRRSATCAASLVARGYREVYNLVGGMIRWNAEEHPIARTQTWR